MVLSTCRFCEHGNPVNAKFCGECGGNLHLLPCPRCGAVSDIKASTCYQCGIPLPGLGTDSVAPSSPTAEIARPVHHRHSRVIVGAVVFAVFAVLGYYLYHQRAIVDASPPSAATNEPRGRSDPASAGIIRRDAAAVDTTPAKADNSGRQPVESRKAKAVATPVARASANKGDSASEQRPSEPCTDVVATLGLCAAKPIQNKEAEKAAATKAAIARPQAIDAGKLGKTEPPRQGACAEAAMALGLCAPTPAVPAVTHTQRKE